MHPYLFCDVEQLNILGDTDPLVRYLRGAEGGAAVDDAVVGRKGGTDGGAAAGGALGGAEGGAVAVAFRLDRRRHAGPRGDDGADRAGLRPLLAAAAGVQRHRRGEGRHLCVRLLPVT